MKQPKSILIKDTTREERERIVARALSVCGGSCNFCNGCGSLGSGRLESVDGPYFEGEKESAESNMEIRSGIVKV